MLDIVCVGGKAVYFLALYQTIYEWSDAQSVWHSRAIHDM
jgi:hypothetical protein